MKFEYNDKESVLIFQSCSFLTQPINVYARLVSDFARHKAVLDKTFSVTNNNNNKR